MKKGKRIVVLILTVFMLLELIPAETLAMSVETTNVLEVNGESNSIKESISGKNEETVNDDNFGNCGENLIWSLDDNGKLLISGTGEMEDYSIATETPWYSKRDSIKEVVIENGVIKIGKNAFNECNNLVDVMIPESVTVIDSEAFAFCANLENIIVDEKNKNYLSNNGVLFNKDQSELISYPAGRSGTYNVPDTTVNIGAYSFAACVKLEELYISNSVKKISENAFNSCKNIKIYFRGNAPTFGDESSDTNVFTDATATIYYRASNNTWTDEILQNYGGNVKWVKWTKDGDRYTVLLLDCSGSMSGTPLTVAKEAAKKFCTSMMGIGDINYISVIGYSDNVSVVCEYTSDLELLISKIDSLSISGGTDIHSALEEADKMLSSDQVLEEASKNIVLLSDGIPVNGIQNHFSGPYTAEDSSEYLRANAVYNKAEELKRKYSIYTLGFFYGLSGNELTFGQRLMNDIQNAGYFNVENVEDLEFEFGEIVDSISERKCNLTLSAPNIILKYEDNKFFDEQIFNKAILRNGSMIARLTWTDQELEDAKSDWITVTMTLPEGFSFLKDEEERTRDLVYNPLEVGSTVAINQNVPIYLYGLKPETTIKTIEYKVRDDKGNTVNENQNIMISKVGESFWGDNILISDLTQISSNDRQQIYNGDTTINGDLIIGSGVNLDIKGNVDINGKIIVKDKGELHISGVVATNEMDVDSGGSVWVGRELNIRKNLNIRKWFFDIGHVYVQGKMGVMKKINIKGGTLIFHEGEIKTCDMEITDGEFIQNNGKAIVEKNFVISSGDISELKGGELWIGGLFQQKSHVKNFQASGQHSTIMYKDGYEIKFGWIWSWESHFNNLYINNKLSLVFDANEIKEHIKGKFGTITVDTSDFTIGRDFKDLDPQRTWETGLMKVYDTDVQVAILSNTLNRELGRENYKVFEKVLIDWFVTETSPFIENEFESIIPDRRGFSMRVKNQNGKKIDITVYAEGMQAGQYGAFHTIFYSSKDLGIENEMIGMLTHTSINTFKRQMAVYLAEGCWDNYKEMFPSAPRKYAETVKNLLDIAIKGEASPSDVIEIVEILEPNKKSSLLRNDTNLDVVSSNVTPAKMSVNNLFKTELFPIEESIESTNVSIAEIRTDPVIDLENEELEKAIIEELGISTTDRLTDSIVNKITKLNLSGKYLNSINGIEKFINLRELDISYNYISDASPLAKLKKLSTLNISANILSDATALGNITSLKTLYISSNNITDINALNQLSKLTILDISNNPLSNLDGFNSLKALKSLNVSNISINSKNLGFISELINLEILYMEHCEITSLKGLNSNNLQIIQVGYNNLDSLEGISVENLKRVNVENNQLTELSVLEKAESLEYLDLSANELKNDAVKFLSKCINLTYLDLSENQLTSTVFLKNCDKLTYLSLDYNILNEIDGLNKKIALQSLYLRGCDLTDSTANVLKTLKELRILDLSLNEFTKASFIKELHNLREMDFSNNKLVDTSEFENVSFSIDISVDPIEVRVVEMKENEYMLNVGETKWISAYIYPYAATNKVITWSSSDDSTVRVDKNGNITALKEGRVTITAQVGDKIDSCNVTVTDKVPIIDVSLGKSELRLVEGQSETLIVDIDPENTTEDKNVKWTSSDESIAIVKDGVVTGVREGTAIITAQVGEKSDSCKVIVSKKQIPITKISLNRTSLQLEEGASETLTVSITPENTTEDRTITWISSDESIVTVKDGIVTGIKEGTATVTAKIGEKSAICDVVVTKKPEIEKPLSISYRTHVQNIGWQNFVSDGVMSGSKGKGLRLEGIEIQLDSNKIGGSVEYRTHVQNVGWQDYVSDGAMAGTKGKSLRLEAIQVRLTGDVSEKYDVYYRTHIQDYGWLGWTMNDGKSGSQGLSKRLEGIEIRLVEKGEAAPGSTDHSYMINTPEKVPNPTVIYTTHVQNVGWQSEVQDGTMAGTKGRGLRLEGIKIRLNEDGLKGGVEYSTHVQNIGWQSYVSDGMMSGTSGKGLRLEGIKIRLTGEIAQKYSIEYRTHVQNEGWQKWVKDGMVSGTSGKSLRLEGIEIRLAKK